MLELDHVVIAAADLEAAAIVLEERYGLRSLEGGRHPGWGTANRIVPLGGAYLELVAVVDDQEAAGSAFGRWVAAARPRPLKLLGWAVRTDELDALARRLDLDVIAGSRTRPTAGSYAGASPAPTVRRSAASCLSSSSGSRNATSRQCCGTGRGSRLSDLSGGAERLRGRLGRRAPWRCTAAPG